jgi:hypothetical protein
MKSPAPTIWELESEAEHLSPQGMRGIVVGGLIALYAVALLLVARRMMGALTEELSWPAVGITALLSFAIVSGLRVLWWRSFSDLGIAKPQAAAKPPATADRRQAAAWVGWGGSLTLLLLAGGVSFPRGGSQDWVIWVPVLVADQWLRWRMAGDEQNFKVPSPSPSPGYWGGGLVKGSKPPATADRRQAAGKDEYQQIVRTRDSMGVEMVTATLRTDFVEGQRNATVYVGFCPPLARVPVITIAPLDGAEAKIVQAFAHGARIDVRLAQLAREAMSVSLNLVAKPQAADGGPAAADFS